LLVLTSFNLHVLLEVQYMLPAVCLAPFSFIGHHFVGWQALAALGLKTGGTVQQRAERLFLTKVIVNRFLHSNRYKM
jgi:hypothetical protein